MGDEQADGQQAQRDACETAPPLPGAGEQLRSAAKKRGGRGGARNCKIARPHGFIVPRTPTLCCWRNKPAPPAGERFCSNATHRPLPPCDRKPSHYNQLWTQQSDLAEAPPGSPDSRKTRPRTPPEHAPAELQSWFSTHLPTPADTLRTPRDPRPPACRLMASRMSTTRPSSCFTKSPALATSPASTVGPAPSPRRIRTS